MNRIRKVNTAEGPVYQVLITPSIKVSPDSALMVGNWDDAELRNYNVISFSTLSDANCEAMKHPDIDWFRLVVNHKYIFQRLNSTIKTVLHDMGFTTEYYPQLMTPEQLKGAMFDRVQRGGERFNLRHGASDIVSFTIVNPWTSNLHKISRALEAYRAHPYRDDLRIREKNIINGKVISLLGYTEFGTTYEIRLVPSLIYQWEQWYLKFGYTKPDQADKQFRDLIKKQDELDKGPVFR